MEERYQRGRIHLHDVSPYTWDACAEWIELCASLGLPPLDLFVIPRHEGGPSDRGAGLPADFVKRLRALRNAGHPLWIHGWTHRNPDGGEGEFSGMDPVQVADRSRRALLDWKAAGLPDPEGFCPPRWDIPSEALPSLFQMGFKQVDLRMGVARPGEMDWSPAISTWGRSGWISNAWNLSLPAQRWMMGPLSPRVVLHPQDVHGTARRAMERVLAALI
jgi:predicted deacetylase